MSFHKFLSLPSPAVPFFIFRLYMTHLLLCLISPYNSSVPFPPHPSFFYLSTVFYCLTFLNLFCLPNSRSFPLDPVLPSPPWSPPLTSPVVYPLWLTKHIRPQTVVWNETKCSSRLLKWTVCPYFQERLSHCSWDCGLKVDIVSFVEYEQIIALFCINFHDNN